MRPLHVRALHTEADGSEQNKQTNNDRVKCKVNGVLHGLVQLSCGPINNKAKSDDGKVESRVVMMNVGNSGHGNEGKVVQEPTNDGIDTGIVEVVDIALREFVVAALPANAVPDDHEAENGKGGSGSPVYEGVAKKEVLDNVVIPAAHTETNMEEWPLPRGGGEVVLLVGVRNEGVVGGHHCNVEVDEIAEERRLVCAWLALGNCSKSEYACQRRGYYGDYLRLSLV